MREAQYLLSRYRGVLAYVGLISALVGLTMLFPLLTMLVQPMDSLAASAFFVPGLMLIAGGLSVWKWLDSSKATLTLQEGGVIVILSWFVAILSGMVPIMVLEKLNLTQAIFESVSAWTTTGLSVIDAAKANPAILLWRSTMQLAGGAGLAIIMLAAIAGPGGTSLSTAEGRTDQLVPNVRASAAMVIRIYSGCVIAGILALHIAGMNWFDAVNHSFCALSTGGFSTKAESIGYWDSPVIESVTIVLMLVGNLNFVSAWCLLKGRFKALSRNGEIRLVAALIPIFAGLLLWLTCAPIYASASKAVRVATFETVSALTTTGYSTVTYGNWNSFGILLLIVLMLIGGGACSTAGAIKQHRIYILIRSLILEIKRPFHPRTIVIDSSFQQGEDRIPISDLQVRSIGNFVFLYLATWISGSAVLAAHGFGIRESLFEFASALGTVGLSIGVTNADAPVIVLWSESAGMLLGRLEFFVIFTGAAKLARDIFRIAKPETAC